MNKFLLLLKNKTIILLATILVANIGLIGFIIYQETNEVKPVEAIDYKMLKENEIKEWYDTNFEESDNLTIKREYNEKIEEGKVIKQIPEAGQEIDPEKGLTIIISNGRDPKKEINLPNFVDEKYTKEMVEKFFNDNFFTDVNYEYEVSEAPKDQVIGINVDNKARRDQLILITLSAGEDDSEIEIEVPNFKEYSVKNAKAWGNSNSVSIRINYVFSDDYPEGEIISQSVKAGLTVNPGYRITLQVSNGKGITLQDFVLKTKDDAITWIEKNGLTYSLIYDYSSSVKKGLIISTEPKKGSIVAEGTKVVLHVSNGPDPDLVKIKVESKAGSSEADFLKYIKELGLSASKQSGNYSDSVKKGLLISNDTGEFTRKQSVGYVLSLGTYSLNVADFEGKKVSSGRSVISQANALNAGVSLKENAQFSDQYAKDTLFNCSVSGKTVTCNLSKGPMANVENYIGQTVTESFTKGNVQYNVVVDDFYTDGSTFGLVYEQSVAGGQKVEPGSTVTLKVRKGEEIKKKIFVANFRIYDGSTLEETVSKLQNQLGDFNLNITYAQDYNQTVGKIMSFKVNDGAITVDGDYPLSTKIDVVICNGKLD